MLIFTVSITCLCQSIKFCYMAHSSFHEQYYHWSDVRGIAGGGEQAFENLTFKSVLEKKLTWMSLIGSSLLQIL